MTVLESPQLILANVNYHLNQGASEIHVFLDDPDDSTGDLLENIPNCFVTRCDTQYWHSINGRKPRRQTRRQTINAQSVYQTSKLDWLIHIDSDEFIYQKTPLVEELSKTTKTRGYLELQVYERIFLDRQISLFDGIFKRPFYGNKSILDSVYGETTIFLKHGMVAYATGKAVVPVGYNLRMGVHYPRTAMKKRMPPLHSTSTVLLHFDGLTREHWTAKLHRFSATGVANRMMGEHRLIQLDSVIHNNEFYDKLKMINSRQYEQLLLLGLVENFQFEIESNLDIDTFNREIKI